MKLQRITVFLKRTFIKNGSWKLLALTIAIFTHFAIREQLSHTRNISVPIEIDAGKLGQNNAIKSKSHEFVDVVLRGSDASVNQLDVKKIRCVVRQIQKNNHPTSESMVLRITRRSFKGLRGVSIVNIEPKKLRVELDSRLSLELAVAPIATQGKARGRVELDFDKNLKVRVTGSRSLLSQVDVAKTLLQPEVVDVEGRAQSFVQSVKLNPPGEDINATLEPSEIRVEVKVTTEKINRTLEHCPVTVIQPPGGRQRWEVEPAEVKVDVSGRRDEVESISYGNVIATVHVDPNNVIEGVASNVTVNVLVLQGINVDQSTPNPATVNLRLLPD